MKRAVLVRVVNAIAKVIEVALNKAMAPTVQKEYTMATSKEGHPVGEPGKHETDPFHSAVAWCYVCRQGLGDEHDTSDPLCLEDLPPKPE